MGLRGPTARLSTVAADKLANLVPPTWLGEEAKEFWTRHAANLDRNNLLTQQTGEILDGWTPVEANRFFGAHLSTVAKRMKACREIVR